MSVAAAAMREESYGLLAAAINAHLDVKYILRLAGLP